MLKPANLLLLILGNWNWKWRIKKEEEEEIKWKGERDFFIKKNYGQIISRSH